MPVTVVGHKGVSNTATPGDRKKSLIFTKSSVHSGENRPVGSSNDGVDTLVVNLPSLGHSFKGSRSSLQSSFRDSFTSNP
jgi:hypothetical protein